ncbi:MAG: hypothetical protein AAGF27_06715 [Pseudomonadota bacterium]
MTDSRDFSDRRNIRVDDRDIDKRAVLSNATQIMDSIYVNIDPSDEVMKSVVNGWQKGVEELMAARRFDTAAASALLNDILDYAHRGQIAINEAQLRQIEAWQNQVRAGAEFAAATLATGERLVQSAGARQATLSDKILDIAAGAVGSTPGTQIRLVTWTLIGTAVVLFAAGRRAT